MSARKDFRNAVVRLMADKFGKNPECKLYHENGPKVNMDTDSLPLVSYEIIYKSSQQAEFAANPAVKDEGVILVTVAVKDMTGNLEAISLRDDAAKLLQRNNLAGAVTAVGDLLPNSYLVKGWVGYRVAIPFWHYHHM